MTKIALGTVQFGLDYGINNKNGKITEANVFKILKMALDNNINTLDTSYLYGDSESVIGSYIEKTGNKFNIVSKLPSFENQDLEKLFFGSLEKLKVQQLYGYLVHHFSFFKDRPEIWEVLENLKKQGLIKKLGFSVYFPEEVNYLLENNISFDLIQLPFNIFDQRFFELLPVLKKRGIEIHTRSVFLQGIVFKDPEELNGNFEKFSEKLTFLKKISAKSNIPVSALCLSFALHHNEIDKVVIGVDSPSNLQENIKIEQFSDQSREFYNDLKSLKENDENIILPFNWDKESG